MSSWLAHSKEKSNKLNILQLEKELAEKVQLISSQEIAIAQYEQELTRTTQVLTIHELEHELAEKVQLLSSQEITIAQHEQELAQKTQELTQTTQELTQKTQDLQNLQTIIDQSRPESDPFDDEFFTMSFEFLAREIQDVVKKHFQKPQSNYKWKEFEDVKGPDDRDYFLQAYIATQIARAFFSPDARVFDLDPKSEADLAKFEDLLHLSHLPPAEIAKWRTQTIKVGRMLPNNYHHTHHKVKLDDFPKRILRDEDCAKAKDSLRMVCNSASYLAISMRGCMAEYEWGQMASPGSFREEDVDRIEPYNPSGGSKGRPARILFGPLYKRVDGALVLLLKGTVLYH